MADNRANGARTNTTDQDFLKFDRRKSSEGTAHKKGWIHSIANQTSRARFTTELDESLYFLAANVSARKERATANLN
jgi:hypothetical protein